MTDRHEDTTLTDELRRLSEKGIAAFGAGDYVQATDEFRAAALLCQGAEWLEREAVKAG